MNCNPSDGASFILLQLQGQQTIAYMRLCYQLISQNAHFGNKDNWNAVGRWKKTHRATSSSSRPVYSNCLHRCYWQEMLIPIKTHPQHPGLFIYTYSHIKTTCSHLSWYLAMKQRRSSTLCASYKMAGLFASWQYDSWSFHLSYSCTAWSSRSATCRTHEHRPVWKTATWDCQCCFITVVALVCVCVFRLISCNILCVLTQKVKYQRQKTFQGCTWAACSSIVRSCGRAIKPESKRWVLSKSIAVSAVDCTDGDTS